MKRIITLIISIALFTATFTVGAYTVKQYNNGDVTRDGNVNVKDATVIQEYVAKMRKFDPMQEKLADVNLDSFYQRQGRDPCTEGYRQARRYA